MSKVRFILIASFIFIDIPVLYILSLCFPQPFFQYQVAYHHLTLYSDRPIPKNAVALLAETESRLGKSEIYDSRQPYRVFICNDLLRFIYFANTNYKVGGINYSFFNRNTFLRKSDIAGNRLFGPSGRKVPGERTLVYYLTHEIMHGVTAQKMGRPAYFRLPVWIREGYADYIARGSFDFEENLRRYRAGEREMDPQKSGLYLRYHLLVAYKLEVQKEKIGELLCGKEKQDMVEAELAGFKP